MKKRERTLDEIMNDPYARWVEAQKRQSKPATVGGVGVIKAVIYGAVLLALYVLLAKSTSIGVATEMLLIFAAGMALYLVPAFVANRRRHHQRQAILVLNLLLGWSVLGWVGALVWAMTAVRKD